MVERPPSGLRDQDFIKIEIKKDQPRLVFLVESNFQLMTSPNNLEPL
jgi:hypothetical protein